MKFYAITGNETVTSDSSALADDYKNGRQIGVIRIGNDHLFFRKLLKVFFIPFGDIRRCYRRVLMVSARMCCGNGNLNIENLVIENDAGEIAQIELPGQKAAVEALKVLQERLPDAQFGCPPKAAVSAGE